MLYPSSSAAAAAPAHDWQSDLAVPLSQTFAHNGHSNPQAVHSQSQHQQQQQQQKQRQPPKPAWDSSSRAASASSSPRSQRLHVAFAEPSHPSQQQQHQQQQHQQQHQHQQQQVPPPLVLLASSRPGSGSIASRGRTGSITSTAASAYGGLGMPSSTSNRKSKTTTTTATGSSGGGGGGSGYASGGLVSASAVSGASKVIAPGDGTRPALLLDMLRYVREELRHLGAERSSLGDPRRLQVFREAFDHFINEFKTYQPILSEIKNEYDHVVQAQREQLDKQESLKGKLSVIRFQSAQELDKVRNEALHAMRSLSMDNQALVAEAEGLKGQIAEAEKRYATLMEDMRRKEISQYSQEHPAVSELRQLANEFAVYERNAQDKLAAKEYEISRLETSFNMAKQELADMHSEIASLQKQLSAAISPLDHQRVKLQLDAALADVERLENETFQAAQARGKQDQKIKDLEAAIKKRDEELYPDWDYIQSGFGSSIREYWTLAKGLDYNETISTLIGELVKARAGGPVAAKSENKDDGSHHASSHSKSAHDEDSQEVAYFVGLGLGSSVPKLLRYKGKVQNRRLSKKDCLQLIRDTWEAKAVFDASPKNKGKRSKMSDFLFMYLKKRFGSQEIVAEWGYNLLDACKKHGFQSVDCQLFHDILNDDVHEEVYHKMQATMERLKNVFYRLDLHLHDGKARGFVPRRDVMLALKKFWPAKSEQQREMLENALESDQPGPNITYRWLFESDGDSVFLDVVREQENEERAAYIQGLQTLFDNFSKDDTLSATDIARLLAMFDADKRKRDLDEYLVRGFGVSGLDMIKAKTMIDKKAFLKASNGTRNLKRGVLVFGLVSDAARADMFEMVAVQAGTGTGTGTGTAEESSGENA
ncbi:hypothetical protein BC831DRAFT_516103 [Entophlyctis helioformis]|nr:hypothetical protein BC831DRAFT_516103 [Entophlyctis helioformis]